MRLTMLALLPLLAPQPAFAESWRLAAYSSNAPQLVYLVDIDSVQRSGTTVTFRQQTLYESTTDTRDFDRTMTTRQADCGSNTSFMRDSSFYVAGKYLDTEAGPSDSTTAQSGSVLRQLIDTVCGRSDYFSPILPAPESWVREKFRSGF
ncbi:MAG: hypothetical protein KAF42_14100 [Sphingopyxis terrae]|uniref:Surface-adhesin protein E-like domain-containing protein n=1 Tax=Sphingopyxis terrae subsp. terrae NBRC 15098 TaxID=1219058 RepID=A0A142VTE6_9SPHN|nr:MULTISPECIES: surface-adhesin E family protein [Sphingopyxis]AMU93060.1 hypothetical protein AOA14_00345 [Sphingopyxis terrae subsp. terrae NBRC 15098]MBU7590333.1 hypothetical protein [Sphingopyxis terrae]QXF12764.1 hypothetical protein HBA51_11770 [Sphingopyxis terrae subsp. terrae]